MSRWLSNFRHWLSLPTSEQTPSNAGIWSLDGLATQTWEDTERQLLLQHKKQFKLCKAQVGLSDDTRTTAILEVDLTQHKVWLDDFVPRLRNMHDLIKLHLNHQMGVLILDLKLVELTPFGRGMAYEADIINKHYYADRRLDDRVFFDVEKAPQVCLNLPFTPPIQGALVNLSVGGLAFAYFGNHRPSLQTQKGQVHIKWSDDWSMSQEIEVRHAQYQRKPNNHTLFRVRFKNIDFMARDKLHGLIHKWSPSLQSS